MEKSRSSGYADTKGENLSRVILLEDKLRRIVYHTLLPYPNDKNRVSDLVRSLRPAGYSHRIQGKESGVLVSFVAATKEVGKYHSRQNRCNICGRNGEVWVQDSDSFQCQFVAHLVAGRTIASSTQHTEVFWSPMSTTQAVESPCPNAAHADSYHIV